MNPIPVIEAVRDGEHLPDGSLEAFLEGYLAGDVEEYQMSAFLMAVVLKGLRRRDLSRLVHIMLHSGAVLELGHLGGPTVDKHSTGGVGDKVSLVLAPLAAECGVYVPMMSGRGLGHTGGTLDKLESIPGFRTDLELDQFQRILEELGAAMIGQTSEIAPLDRRLYALRSVSGTVPSIPLIAASIMSKKLAEGLQGLVLDVKVGAGAFLPDEERALELGRTMVEIGADHGVPTVALATAMDRPLGRTVGNALEVRESLDCLRGAGPPDLREVVVSLVTEMLLVGELASDSSEARSTVTEALDSGRPLERFRRMVELQGGDPRAMDDPGRLPTAPIHLEVRARGDGRLHALDPLILGRAAVELGGGRTRLGQKIDPAVGYAELTPPGSELAVGDLLGIVHAADRDAAEVAADALRRAARVDGDGVEPRAQVSHRIDERGVQELRSGP